MSMINQFLAATNYHRSWHDILCTALESMSMTYLEQLSTNPAWLPGMPRVFHAFNQPLDQVQHVLIGESPYPRAKSANGYAFWDQAITQLWSPSGLSKEANRATSFRNILKMLLVAEGHLAPDQVDQASISRVDKHGLVMTNQAFFENLLKQGFLLLNASLSLGSQKTVREEAKAWLPFFHAILLGIVKYRPNAHFLLFGKIALQVQDWLPSSQILIAEHPYNLSFIHNPEVIRYFSSLKLLKQ